MTPDARAGFRPYDILEGWGAGGLEGWGGGGGSSAQVLPGSRYSRRRVRTDLGAYTSGGQKGGDIAATVDNPSHHIVLARV